MGSKQAVVLEEVVLANPLELEAPQSMLGV